MPLPWKKARVGRISRLVADLQSPKRGGSLVVETGFPTSLIDLFVKNRDRLKTSRRRRSRVSDPVPPQPAEPRQQRRPESVRSVQAQTSSDSCSEIRSVECEEEEVGGIDGSSLVDGGGEVEDSLVGRPSGRGVAVAVLKMSVVVILAMSTKKLAVGITMSAFLLLFLEYAVKWVVGLFTPCSDALIAINSLIQKVFPFLVTEHTASNLNPPDASTPRTLSNACVEEIQIAESQFDFPAPREETPEIQEIQTVRPKIDMPAGAGERKWGDTEVKETEGDIEKEKEEEEVIQALEPKHRHSRSARLKSKIKKYIPKKIRGRKWGSDKEKGRGSDSGSEVSSCAGGDKAGSFQEEEEEEQDDEDKSIRSPPLEEEEDKLSAELDMNSASCSSEMISQNDAEADLVGENPEKEGIARNSGYLVLFLIVLAGLLGGRFLAFLLTVTWCLMLKLFKKKLTLLA